MLGVTKFWLVLLVVGMSVWLVQSKFRSAKPNPFSIRAPISPREQLLAHSFDERSIDEAICIWKEMALSYQIDPTQLRVDDKITDIVSRDWFGDSGLSIEAKLTAIGSVPLPNDATLLDLIHLLANREKC